MSPTKFKRLSAAEAQLKREKVLCYRCNEKWQVGHRCKMRDLHVLSVSDDFRQDETIEESIVADPDGELVDIEISLNALEGLVSLQNLEMMGTLKEKPVVVMVDCRVVHNFISLKVIDELALKISPTGTYKVLIGDGENFNGAGVCRGVAL